jgi:hypothetical protein
MRSVQWYGHYGERAGLGRRSTDLAEDHLAGWPYNDAMFGVRTTIQGLPIGQVGAIEDAITSVLKDADPAWHVTLNVDDDGAWHLFGQPGDGSGIKAQLDEHERSPEGIRQKLFEWYEQYKEGRLQ